MISIKTVIVIIAAILIGASIGAHKASQRGQISGCEAVFTNILPDQLQPRCLFKNGALVGSAVIPLRGEVIIDLSTGEIIE